MKHLFDIERLLNTVPNTVFGNGEFKNSYGKTTALFFDSEPYKGKKTTVFSYLGVPDGAMPLGGFPGIVLAHGGGGCAFYEWVEYWNSKGYVAIAVDFSGRQYGTVTLSGASGVGIVEVNPNGRPADYGSANETRQSFYDSWIYHSVSNIVLAHNILLNNKYVNPEKTVLTGISWGSVLTCIASGIDNRFVAFAPVYGGGFLEYDGCISLKDKTADELEEWIELYDPASYLCSCEKPILFMVGMNDTNFSSYANTKSSELCKGKVYYSNRLLLEHEHLWEDRDGMAIVERFLSSYVCDKPMPFNVLSSEISENKLTVTVDKPQVLKNIWFCYTQSRDEDFTRWVWQRKKLKISNGNKIISSIPKATAACFVEMSDADERGNILSTKTFFKY